MSKHKISWSVHVMFVIIAGAALFTGITASAEENVNRYCPGEPTPCYDGCKPTGTLPCDVENPPPCVIGTEPDCPDSAIISSTLGDAGDFLIAATLGNTKLGTSTTVNYDIGGNTDVIGPYSIIQGNVVAA
jgi:hypothetical protein